MPVPSSMRSASIRVMLSGAVSISASRARSRAWSTSTHLPLRKASPSVCASRARTSSPVSGTPSTTSSGCAEINASKPSMDGFFSPSFIVSATLDARFFHQFGMPQRMPVDSIASICLRNA